MCSKIEKDFNDAMWRLNGKKTECDKCKLHRKCFKKGLLTVYFTSDDYGAMPDYDYNGAHAITKPDKKCPKQEEKDERK